MAHYDIFSAQLAIKYPACGHALWYPSPPTLYCPVEVGDVGFIRGGRFHRLFNALLSADHPSHKLGVPEYHEPLIPSLSDHICDGMISPTNFCSAGIDVETDESDVRAFGPDDFSRVSFSCKRKRVGAALFLPVESHCQDTLARADFAKWIVKHIDTWFAFTKKLGLGIEQMEEIILVTGRDRTKSWVNVAFLGCEADAQGSFGFKVVPDLVGDSIEWQLCPGKVRGAVLNKGPGGKNLLENQCVFVRGFRVARTFGIFPKHLKAAAETPDADEHDKEPGPDKKVISIPAVTMNPLHTLIEYVAERAPECDMVLVHDEDLASISRTCDSNSSENLQPDVVNSYLERSKTKIHKVSWDASPNKTADEKVVEVATISNMSLSESQVTSGQRISNQTSSSAHPSTTDDTPKRVVEHPQAFPRYESHDTYMDRNTSNRVPPLANLSYHQQSHGQLSITVGSSLYHASSDRRAPVNSQTYTSHGYRPLNPQTTSISDTYATSVRQQEPQQARSFVSGHTRNEGRQPQSTRSCPNDPVQPRTAAATSNLNNLGRSKCRLPRCGQPQFFDDRTQEHLDYCRDHIYTAVSGGFAAWCERCRELPARHDSRYCSGSCSSAADVMGTSVVRQQYIGSVPPGWAPSCQECRRPMPDAGPNQRFCSPACEDVDRRQLRRH